MTGCRRGRRGVRRPGWERLLERVEAGESDGIVVWHTDRLFRQPRDLERVDRRWVRRGFTVASAHGARDLADPDDRYHPADRGRPRRPVLAMTRRGGSSAGLRRMRANGVSKTGGPRLFGFPGYVVLSQRDKDRLAETRARPGRWCRPGRWRAERQRVAGGDRPRCLSGVSDLYGHRAGVERGGVAHGVGQDVGIGWPCGIGAGRVATNAGSDRARGGRWSATLHW